MIETEKYIHGLHSVNTGLLKTDIETVTRGHKYKPASKKKKKNCLQSHGQLELVAISDVVDAPSLQAFIVLRAGWMRSGKTRSFFTEFAYPCSDLSV